MSDDIDRAYSEWLDTARDTDAYYAFKAGAQYKEREVAKKAYLLDKSVHERMSKYLEIIEHQAAQADKLAESLEPFVQQYRHLTDEEIRKVSGKSFSERYIKARTALKAYRGE